MLGSALFREFLGAVVRWLLTAAATAMVARGIITGEQAQRVVAGLTEWMVPEIILVLTLAWSLWHKHRGQLLLRAARLLPAGADDEALRAKAREIAGA